MLEAEIVLRPIFADALHGSRVGALKFSRDRGGAAGGSRIYFSAVLLAKVDEREMIIRD